MATVPIGHGVVAGPAPLYATLIQFPAVCFTLTLLTDLAYWQTANLMWQNFSSWLLFAGLVVGGLGLVVGLIEMLVSRRVRLLRPSWLAIVAIIIAMGLALVNSLVHAGDGWTAVVPWGLALSAVTVLVLLVAAIAQRRADARTF